MRSSGVRWAAGAIGFFFLGCSPGNVAFRQGRKAEARKDYDSAVIDFEKALQQAPENPRYLLHDKLARTKAAEFHTQQGERLLEEKRTDAAVGEFQKAVSIDPTNERAAEELRRLLAAQASAEVAREKALKEALKPPPPEEHLGVKLKPLPSQIQSRLRVAADSRQVFRTLASLAGLNVVFTHDFQPRPILLDLTDVTIEQALQAASYEANVFWKPIAPNTILVIPDTPTNHREYDDEVLQTFHLANPLQPADRTQISTALKQVLGLQRIIDNPNSNAIIIRDTPDKVAAAGQLIRSLDLERGEILVDVTVLEANRDRIRTLGLSPAPITGSTQAAIAFTPPATSSSSSGTTGGTAISPLPLNKLGKISTADFSVVLPGAIANALLNDAQTHVLDNPEVRVTDGQTAKLQIGSRVPYATGSFLPSFAGATTGAAAGGFGLLASTQFNYQDVGVNLEITPHLTASGEVSLHAKINISSVGSPVVIGGLSEPSFNQRVIEHDIQLKEGEVSLLGGLIQRQENRTVTGLPGLGDIPVLRYFFSQEQKEVTDDEVLIMLTPHIVRLPEVPPATPATVQSGVMPEPGALPEAFPGVQVTPGVQPQ